MYYFYITDKMLDDSPAWSDGTDQPPLAPRQALTAAKAQLPNIVPELNEWRVRSITLRLVKDGKWVYTIDFDDLDYERRTYDGPVQMIMLVVMMNGEAVMPKVEEAKFLFKGKSSQSQTKQETN